jgi:2-hydroxychromene-2-carboxylate isomerase
VARVEFFFDCSSPWTYLAFDRIEGLCAEAGAELVWKPILVGGVFNSVNPSVYEQRAKPVPAKAHYYLKDLQDWARLYGLKIGQPPVFPVNSVKAMRGALVADEHGRLPAWARAVFEAYWGQLLDISKARLRANTDELMRRGGFGSPTMFVDGDDMYFGNDRLPLIREALRANV